MQHAHCTSHSTHQVLVQQQQYSN